MTIGTAMYWREWIWVDADLKKRERLADDVDPPALFDNDATVNDDEVGRAIELVGEVAKAE